MIVSECPTRRTHQTYPKAVRESLHNDYIQGRGTVGQLAELYGVKKVTAESWCRNGGWVKERDERLAVIQPISPVVMPAPAIDPVEVDRDEYREALIEWRGSHKVIRQQWEAAVKLADDPSLSPSERVAALRVSVVLHERWQESLQIPSVGPVKPNTTEPKNVPSTPVLPLD